MERKLYKELWQLRFDKMLKLEQQSVDDYQGLLQECEKSYKDHAIANHLKKLIQDEQKHVNLVQELIRILERQQ